MYYHQCPRLTVFLFFVARQGCFLLLPSFLVSSGESSPRSWDSRWPRDDPWENVNTVSKPPLPSPPPSSSPQDRARLADLSFCPIPHFEACLQSTIWKDLYNQASIIIKYLFIINYRLAINIKLVRQLFTVQDTNWRVSRNVERKG